MKTTQFIEGQSPILHYFDQIYIINLEERVDRLKEVENELAKIGVHLSHPNVHLFKATKPSQHENWPSAGTKGCFLSHLAILKDAQKHQYQRILVLEDDVQFTSDFNRKMEALIPQLNNVSWDIFYGGYQMAEQAKIAITNAFNSPSQNKSLYLSPSDTNVLCSHCVAFNQSIIAALVQYLEAMMVRPAGHIAGGPMHVDGAFSWFRKEYPHIQTALAFPTLAIQRSSRTDIHDLKWMDTMPFIKNATSVARKIRNKISELN